MPPRLATSVMASFTGLPAAMRIFSRFLSRREYSRRFASSLMRSSRDERLEWELRCAAVLMLEHQAFLLWQGKNAERDAGSFFTTLGVPPDLAPDLQARMSRLNRIHGRIRGYDTESEALLDFIHVSRRESKLTLARYLFSPEEVADRIRRLVRSTPGIPRNPHEQWPQGCDGPLAGVGAFDREVAAILRARDRVLWVGRHTPSEINSLVEYPLSTVALVIKPPGSDLEFEVKRAGMRGPHALDALYERNGEPVPHFHRLQGASAGFMLDFEHHAGDRFSGIYREVHKVSPPMSRVLGITSISFVPGASGDAQILDYFSGARAYGDGFEGMSEQLKKCVQAFESGTPRAELDTGIGWAMRFISATVPNQAWLAGSTSFRLDRTADLLSPSGADLYFREGLGRDFNFDDARRFADELLEEILGVLTPPAEGPRSYGDYLEAAFDLPPNRAAADDAYLRCMRDIGLYWGTLAALGGFSEGESFVPRNVGLKSRWQEGQWRAGICFMDHDCLHAPGWSGNIPAPARAIDSLRKDEGWICGKNPHARSEFMCLQAIYRVSSSVETQGLAIFRGQVKAAWMATREAMENNPAVQSRFDPDYHKTLARRDRVIGLYFESRGSGAEMKTWKKVSTAMLRDSLYSAGDIPGFLDSIVHYEWLLDAYRFLF